jgi:DnaK suppressor protein
MSSYLSPAQLKLFKAELLELLASLRDEVGSELEDLQGERVHEVMKEAHDSGDEATAELESTISLAHMSRHLQEVRECQDALQRLEHGTYGLCVDCGEEVELNRLKATPVSSRCLSCQSKEEHEHNENHHASM